MSAIPGDPRNAKAVIRSPGDDGSNYYTTLIEFTIVARAFEWEGMTPRNQRVQVELIHIKRRQRLALEGGIGEGWTVRVYDETCGMFTWRHILPRTTIDECVRRACGEDT